MRYSNKEIADKSIIQAKTLFKAFKEAPYDLKLRNQAEKAFKLAENNVMAYHQKQQPGDVSKTTQELDTEIDTLRQSWSVANQVLIGTFDTILAQSATNSNGNSYVRYDLTQKKQGLFVNQNNSGHSTETWAVAQQFIKIFEVKYGPEAGKAANKLFRAKFGLTYTPITLADISELMKDPKIAAALPLILSLKIT